MLLQKYQKQEILDILKKLNKQILKDFIRLKQEFSSKQIANNYISNSFKTWKPVLSQTVERCLEKIIQQNTSIQQDNVNLFNFTGLVKELTDKYGKDQDYIECIRCLNSTIQMMKQFIRIKAIKDPTTAVYEQQFKTSINEKNI